MGYYTSIQNRLPLGETIQRLADNIPPDTRDEFDRLRDPSFSEPMMIGKHEWRLRYEAEGTINYEWRRPPAMRWEHYRDWPTYDFNNGMTLGLPAGLKRLYARQAADVAVQKAKRFVIVDITVRVKTVRLVSPEGMTYACYDAHCQLLKIRDPRVQGSERIVLDAASPIVARLTQLVA